MFSNPEMVMYLVKLIRWPEQGYRGVQGDQDDLWVTRVISHGHLWAAPNSSLMSFKCSKGDTLDTQSNPKEAVWEQSKFLLKNDNTSFRFFFFSIIISAFSFQLQRSAAFMRPQPRMFLSVTWSQKIWKGCRTNKFLGRKTCLHHIFASQ